MSEESVSQAVGGTIRGTSTKIAPELAQPRRPFDDGITTTTPDRKEKKRNPWLRYCEPYWHPYRTSVKQRWLGRQILEVVSTEFRDRSVEYYRYALENGVTLVNGKKVGPGYVLNSNDRIENTVHRHEPSITIAPILILHRDDEKQFLVISKPGSVPVHATGRYFRHTILELLLADHGIKAYSVNRLDRLTSGLMILALTGKASTSLAQEFIRGDVKKEYLARVRGEFPEEEVEVDLALLTVDRQMGLVICTPEGKDARTIFKRRSYDRERGESVVHCRPMTGRTHQIRVHLQYLGHPIINDPLYGDEAIWGPELGKGGVDLTPDMEDLEDSDGANAISLLSVDARIRGEEGLPSNMAPPKFSLAPGMTRKTTADVSKIHKEVAEGRGVETAGSKLPREREGEQDETLVGGSPIYLSRQVREIIRKLRRQKDDQEDWARWSEVSMDKDAEIPEGFCEECRVPLAPDPAPDRLFIYLHAWRYTTVNLGSWETPFPNWATEEWDGSIA